MTDRTRPLPVAQLTLGLITGLIVIWIYWPVLTSLVTQLANDEDFSFGLLLPPVSAYIVYLKWPQIRSTPWRPSWLGVPLIILAFCIFISGKLIADVYSVRLSFLILIGGLFLFLGGWGILRLFSFPLVILILMLPLPGIITSTITLPLQLISSKLAAIFLRVLGVTLVLQGNVIDLGFRQLQVVAACSGLRYILSLLALGTIYCYFYQHRFWKSIILIISLIPTSILANAIRVAAMGFFPSLQEGFWHGFSGWLIFIFCLGLLIAFNALLDYVVPDSKTNVGSAPPDQPENQSYPPKIPLTPYWTSLALVILGGLLIQTIASPPPVPLLKSFDHFPLTIGPWRGERTFMDSEIFQKTEADDYLDATYTSPNSANVNLYIAHYAKQVTPGGLAHNPSVCMRGAGWKTLSMGTLKIAPGREVNYLVVQRDLSPPLLVYWWNLYQGHWVALKGDTIWASRLTKLYTIYSVLLGQHRTDWALIRLITPVDKDLASANERLTAFVQLISHTLPQFISTDLTK
jgi:exosortase D (VPLPA-CTERM-specific)